MSIRQAFNPSERLQVEAEFHRLTRREVGIDSRSGGDAEVGTCPSDISAGKALKYLRFFIGFIPKLLTISTASHYQHTPHHFTARQCRHRGVHLFQRIRAGDHFIEFQSLLHV